jgi:hypothetical protein
MGTASTASPRLGGEILPHLLQTLQEHRYTAQAVLDALTPPLAQTSTDCTLNDEPGNASDGDDANDPVSLSVEEEIQFRVEQLRSSDEATKASSAEILLKLVSDVDTTAMMTAAGDVELWMQLLSAGTDLYVVTAVRALIHLNCDASAPPSMVPSPLDKGRTISLLVNALSTCRSDNAKDATARLLWVLSARHAARRKAIVLAGAIPTLTKITLDNSGNVEQAGSLLRCVAGGLESCPAVVVEQSIPSLLRLIKEGSTGLKWIAMETLSSLSVHAEHQGAIASAGIIPVLINTLVEVIQTGAEPTNWKAQHILCNMAISDISRSAVVAGITPCLKMVFTASADDVKVAVCTIMSRLANNADCCNAIVAAGVLSSLLEALKAGSNEVQIAGCVLLREMAMHAECCKALASVGAISYLVDLLKGSADNLKAIAWKTLHKIALKADCRKTVVAAGAIPVFLQLLKGDASAKAQAAATLYALSIDDQCKNAIASTEAIPLLVQLLREGDQAGKENAAALLTSLSKYPENNGDIAQAGAIPPLVRLLRCESAGGKLKAATALLWLSVDDACSRIIIATGAIRLLVLLLKDDAEATRKAVLGTLNNLGATLEGLTVIRREHETLKWVREWGAVDVRGFADEVLSAVLIR